MTPQAKFKQELQKVLVKYFFGNKDADKTVDEIIEVFSKYPPPHQSFNQVQDLRGYLLHHPNGEMVAVSCLHFLGDDAQQWWAGKQKIV